METAEPMERKKPGRIPGPETVKYNVLLPPTLAEWGKRQPGGLSETIRGLLLAAHDKHTRENGANS